MTSIKVSLAAFLVVVAGHAFAFEATNGIATFASPAAGSAYVTITSDTDDTLTSLSSYCCKAVELHIITTKKGVMRMRKLDSLEVKTGKPIAISGGHGMGDSMHLMLIDPTHPMRPGMQFPITFHFAKQPAQTVNFKVVESGHE